MCSPAQAHLSSCGFLALSAYLCPKRRRGCCRCCCWRSVPATLLQRGHTTGQCPQELRVLPSRLLLSHGAAREASCGQRCGVSRQLVAWCVSRPDSRPPPYPVAVTAAALLRSKRSIWQRGIDVAAPPIRGWQPGAGVCAPLASLPKSKAQRKVDCAAAIMMLGAAPGGHTDSHSSGPTQGPRNGGLGGVAISRGSGGVKWRDARGKSLT